MSNSPKIFFHIDLNCFFASCEIAENPALNNKPIAVAPTDPFHRGIILSPSYEARAFGIKTTMLVKDALLLCRDLIVVPPRMKLYSQYSKKFFDYLYNLTSNIEAGSIDEGYVDVSDICGDIHPLKLAESIQNDLMKMYNLPCSIGIGPNTFLAKMASDYKKPLGITVFRKREIALNLWRLPIEKMYGVGKKTAPKLKEIGINTIGDLANYKDEYKLKNTVGPTNAESLLYHAQGNGRTEIEITDTEAMSVSNAHTFSHLIYDSLLLKNTLKVIANTVGHRLEKANQKAYTIGIILKYGDLRQINRSRGLDRAISSGNDIYRISEEIFDEYYKTGDQIRLIGIFAHRLTTVTEVIQKISLFDDLSEIEKENTVDNLVKTLQDKYGKQLINQGINNQNE